MKAYETSVKVTIDGQLDIPDSLIAVLPRDQIVRLIVLVDESSDSAQLGAQQLSTRLQMPDIDGTVHLPPTIVDPDEQAHILNQIIENMQQNPIPPDAPPLTREALHERRWY